MTTVQTSQKSPIKNRDYLATEKNDMRKDASHLSIISLIERKVVLSRHALYHNFKKNKFI